MTYPYFWQEGALTMAAYKGSKIVWNKATNKFVDTESGKTVKPGDRISFVDENGFQKSKLVTADDLKSKERFREKLGPTPDKFSVGAKKLSKLTSSFSSNSLSSSGINEPIDKSDNANNDSTTDKTTDKTKTLDKQENSIHKDSLNKDNTIIAKNDKKVNTAEKKIENGIDEKRNKNHANLKDNKISKDDFKKQEIKLDQLSENLKKGKVHFNDLYKEGIKPTELDLKMGKKGEVNFERTNASFKNAEQKALEIEPNKSVLAQNTGKSAELDEIKQTA